MKAITYFYPVWKLLLRFYPRSFRERFGAEMLQVLATTGRQQAQQRGTIGAVVMCLTSCGELCWCGIRERLEEMPMMTWLIGLLAVACGLFAGYVDFHNDEVQPAALVLIVSGFVLALARPKHALLWAPLIGLGVPLVHFIGRRLGYQPDYPVSLSSYAAFLLPAFVALLGALAGVVTRKIVRPS
jgi:apolipoprotein N-acyltransferase